MQPAGCFHHQHRLTRPLMSTHQPIQLLHALPRRRQRARLRDQTSLACAHPDPVPRLLGSIATTNVDPGSASRSSNDTTHLQLLDSWTTLSESSRSTAIS
jgi:hypothetical protein